jgi:hypothetical protein
MRSLAAVLFAATLVAQGPFTQARHATNPLPPCQDVAVGDVDGDGNLDIVGVVDGFPTSLLLGDGRGSFTLAAPGRLPSGPSRASSQVDLADIDGDGDLDCLTVGDLGDGPRVYRNNGAGVFADVTATALPGTRPQDSGDQIVGDFDGDGDLDWFVLDRVLPRNAFLYLNNGAGQFVDSSATNLAALTNSIPTPTDVGGSQAADLDRDGDLDLVIINWHVLMAVLVNQGAGVFLPLLVPPPSGPQAAWQVPIVLGDFDGDGLVDALLQPSGGKLLLRNLGGFAFADVSAAGVPAGSQTDWLVQAIDCDADGDLDLVGGALWLNNGSGVFTRTTGVAPSGDMIGAVDADGDGDQDLLVSSSWPRWSGPMNLLSNFVRQLESPAPPVRGQNYAVQVFAPPGPGATVVMPALSFAGAALPLGALGVLRLDPAQLIELPWQFGPSRPSTVTIAVPANPQLAGLPVHVQALIVDAARPLHLSNAIVDVVQ